MANHTEREFHPACNLFPLLTGKAFDDLVEDIRRNGLREPILIDAQGRILDGRNRYRACLAACVEPRFVTCQGAGSPWEITLSCNLHRRHLTESQRAMVAARLARWLGANLHPPDVGRCRDKAAQTVNVSPRLTAYAIKVLREGVEELITAVECEGLAVSTASILAGLPAAQQSEILAAGVRAASAKARELRRAKKRPSPPAPGRPFGIVSAETPASGDVALIWVPTPALAHAVEILRAGGFLYSPSEA
jgi:hypothetical protein